jgi:ankyrin repeat protein
MDNGADVNINPTYGQSPLGVAIKSGNPDMVRLHLHHGAWVTKGELELFNTITSGA